MNYEPPGLSEDRKLIKDVFGLEPDILDKFDWPPSGDSAVFRSLCYHMDKFLRVRSKTVEPSEEEIEKLLIVVERYMRGVSFVMPDKPPEYPEFKELVARNVDMSTSPGYPWLDMGHTTNGQSLGFKNGLLKEASRLEEHYRTFLHRWQELKEGPKLDLINLFIKAEPHKDSKIEKSAYRLISGVGLTDKLIAFWLYESLVTVIADKHQELPIQIGVSIRNGGLKHIVHRFTNEATEMDKSSWDWTMQSWIWDVITRYISRISASDNRVHANHILALAGATFKFGKHQFRPSVGLMKSGHYGTFYKGHFKRVMDTKQRSFYKSNVHKTKVIL